MNIRNTYIFFKLTKYFPCFLVPAPGAPGNTVGSGGGQGNNMVQLSTTGGGSSGLNPSIHRPSISQNQQRQASDCSSSQHTVSNLVTVLSSKVLDYQVLHTLKKFTVKSRVLTCVYNMEINFFPIGHSK